GLLAVVDDEGEEAAGRVGLALDGGDQGDGVAVADHDGAVGLLGHLAGFDGQRFGAKGTFNTTCMHGRFLARTGRRGSGSGGGFTRWGRAKSLPCPRSDDPTVGRAPARPYLRRPSRPMSDRYRLRSVLRR